MCCYFFDSGLHFLLALHCFLLGTCLLLGYSMDLTSQLIINHLFQLSDPLLMIILEFFVLLILEGK